jgi:hypothetical protein
MKQKAPDDPFNEQETVRSREAALKCVQPDLSIIVEDVGSLSLPSEKHQG